MIGRLCRIFLCPLLVPYVLIGCVVYLMLEIGQLVSMPFIWIVTGKYRSTERMDDYSEEAAEKLVTQLGFCKLINYIAKGKWGV